MNIIFMSLLAFIQSRAICPFSASKTVAPYCFKKVTSNLLFTGWSSATRIFIPLAIFEVADCSVVVGVDS